MVRLLGLRRWYRTIESHKVNGYNSCTTRPSRMSSRLLPESATPDARRLLWTRSLRGFADGVVSVLLADYLLRLGFSAAQVGVVVTSTLLGSAVLTIAVGLGAHRLEHRILLLAASALMLFTGLLFAGLH